MKRFLLFVTLTIIAVNASFSQTYTTGQGNWTDTWSQNAGAFDFTNGVGLYSSGNAGNDGITRARLITTDGTAGGTATTLNPGQKLTFRVAGQDASGRTGITTGGRIGFALRTNSSLFYDAGSTNVFSRYDASSIVRVEYIGGNGTATFTNSGGSSSGNMPNFSTFKSGVTFEVEVISDKEFNLVIGGTRDNVQAFANGGGSIRQVTITNISQNMDGLFTNLAVSNIPINLTANGAELFTVSGVVSNNGATTNTVQKNGTGTVELTGISTYTGSTTINAGTLKLAHVGGGTVPVTNNVTVSGGTLEIVSDQTLNNITLASGATLLVDPGVTLTVTGSLNNSGTLTNNGNVVVNGSLQMNQGSSITGSAISYGSSSTLVYGGTSTQTATALEFPSSNGPVNLTVNASSTLSIPSSFVRTVSGNITVASTGSISVGSNLTVGGNFSNSGTYSAGAVLIFGGTGTQTWTDVNGNTYPFVAVNNSGYGAQMNNDITIGALDLSAGVLDINGHSFTITALINYTSGTITGSSTSNMVIGSTAGTLNFTQTSPATRSLNNLTLNSGASATLGNALDVYGTVTVTAATLHLNGKNLTLKSNSAGTARIADLNSSTLDGATNVTMERYIKLRTGGTGRAYRLLAPTVNTSGSINANWQEGQVNTVVGTYVNTNPNYGTHITGSGGSANGFDVTQSNAPSLYLSSNGVLPNYTAVTSTSGTLNALTGYYLYVRGDRSVSTTLPLAAGMPTSSTTLRTTGTMLQGTINSFTNGFDNTTGAMNLVTNPYPSAIDWSLIYPSNITNVAPVYTTWDANVGTRGGFVTVTTTGVAVPPESGANQYIQSGQAFLVQATGVGSVALTLQENQKVSNNNNNVFRGGGTDATQRFSASLFFNEPNGFRRLADGVMAIYDNSYSASVDGNDAREINNWDENIAINREGKHLSLEFRPVIQKEDELPLFMNNMKQMNYEFQFIPSGFSNPYLKAELIDKFLGTRTLLSLKDTVVVPFSITSDPASAGSERFKIVFSAALPPIDQLTINAYQKNKGVQVEWTSKTETAMDHYEVERSTDGIQFNQQATIAAVGNSAVAVNYNWFDMAPQPGNNFYRVKATNKIGQVKYTDAIKVTLGKGQPAISVYPNPLSTDNLGLQLRDLDKGTYTISLYNKLGQQVFSTEILYTGGTAVMSLPLNNKVVQGIYQLVLTGENNVKISSQVIRN